MLKAARFDRHYYFYFFCSIFLCDVTTFGFGQEQKASGVDTSQTARRNDRPGKERCASLATFQVYICVSIINQLR